MRTLMAIALLLVMNLSAYADPVHEKIFQQTDSVICITAGQEYDVQQPDGSMGKEMRWGMFSGFIFKDNDGIWVLTAGHIEHQGEGPPIKKILAYFRQLDREPVELKMVGYDHRLDVALLKFANPKAAQGLPMSTLGSSAKLKIGQDIISIGFPSPLYKDTLTVGQVNSFLAGPNDVFSGSDQPQLIVHDGLINRGNSGSPILNTNGEVVGINVMLYPGAVYANPFTGEVSLINIYSVAIPIDDVKRLLPVLKKANGGEIQHSSVQMCFDYSSRFHEVDLKARNINKKPRVAGVMVTRVINDTLAAKVGFQPGDIILACDGKPVTLPADNSDSVLFELYRTFYLEADLKKKFDLKINRDGIEMTLPLLLSDPNPELPAVAPKPSDDSNNPEESK
ncbi:MAG: S1C family serine protease [Patescibacteria group bacterium]